MPEISGLPELAEAPADDDLLVIVDVSAPPGSRTKKIRADRVGGGASSGVRFVGAHHLQSYRGYSGSGAPEFPNTAHDEDIYEAGRDFLNIFMGWNMTNIPVPAEWTPPEGTQIVAEWDPDASYVFGEPWMEVNDDWALNSWWGDAPEPWTFCMSLGPGYYKVEAKMQAYTQGFGALGNAWTGYSGPSMRFDAYDEPDGSGEYISAFDPIINIGGDYGGHTMLASGIILIPEGPDWVVDGFIFPLMLPDSRPWGITYASITFDMEKWVDES